MFSNFAGYGLNLFLSFICRVLFVHYLKEEYLGINGLFSNILSMLSLSELGIGAAIGYALYKPIAEDNKDKIASLMDYYGKAYRVIGCAVAVFGLCMMPFLDIFIKERPDIPESLHVIYLLYLFNSASTYFFSYRGTILTAYQRNYILTTINYIVVIIQNIVQVIILITTRNFILYLIAQIICQFITKVLISEKAQKDYPFINNKNKTPLTREEKKTLFTNVKALTVTKLSGLLVNNTDSIVITYFDGLITTGVASNYTLLTVTLRTMLNLVFGSTSASIGNVNAKEDNKTKYFIFKVINLLSFWLNGWAAIGIAFVSGDIIRLIFGPQFVLSQSIPVVLAVSFYVSGMHTTASTHKGTLGFFKYGQYLLLITALLNIVGDVILGKKYGLFGIYLATIIARLLTNAWYDPYVVYKYGFSTSFKQYIDSYLKQVCVIIVSAGLCYFILSIIKVNLIVKLILDIVICSIIPNGIFFLVYHNNEEYVFLWKKIKHIVAAVKQKIGRT